MGNELTSQQHMDLATARSAHNYHPLPVVAAHAEGSWVTDVDGNRYLDCLAGYSALNFGHGHPALVDAAREQLERLTLVSRAFHHEQFGRFCDELAAQCGKDMVLPMNTGAEAVETAIKVARRWAYQVKGVPADQAHIVVAADNFHGRTTTIVGFSTDETARTGFGPFTPGFTVVPYGDLAALEAAISDDTAAVLIEPIQGEAGVIIPPDGYLAGVADTCARNRVLFVADEIQSGLGRTGRTFAVDHEGVTPDVFILGKALGGGIVPVSAVVADAEIMEVISPGSHGSTFGGNPLACAVGRAVLELLRSGEPQANAARLGQVLTDRLQPLVGKGLVGVRSRGLWAGIDVDPAIGTGRDLCEALLARRVLVKDTHGSTIRLAPPLSTDEADLHWAVDQLEAVLTG